jgi:hypothetical protein
LKLLDRTFKEGDVVEVDFEDNKLVFRKGVVEEVKV